MTEGPAEVYRVYKQDLLGKVALVGLCGGEKKNESGLNPRIRTLCLFEVLQFRYCLSYWVLGTLHSTVLLTSKGRLLPATGHQNLEGDQEWTVVLVYPWVLLYFASCIPPPRFLSTTGEQSSSATRSCHQVVMVRHRQGQTGSSEIRTKNKPSLLQVRDFVNNTPIVGAFQNTLL